MYYLEILEELFTTLVDYDFDLDELIFQQNKVFAHTIKIVQEWFRKQSYSVMEWLAQSLDLNLIEHV
jgi:hypothetical protein